MALHPIKALDHVIEEYRAYLLTEFRAKDANLRAALERELDAPRFLAQEPFFQAHRPFKPGKAWRELPLDVRLAGLTAILVYPMNALANDQKLRIEDYLEGAGFAGAVRVEQYDRSTSQAKRDEMRANPPHILLTHPAADVDLRHRRTTSKRSHRAKRHPRERADSRSHVRARAWRRTCRWDPRRAAPPSPSLHPRRLEILSLRKPGLWPVVSQGRGAMLDVQPPHGAALPLPQLRRRLLAVYWRPGRWAIGADRRSRGWPGADAL